MRPYQWEPLPRERDAAADGFRRGLLLGCAMFAPWFLFLYR